MKRVFSNYLSPLLIILIFPYPAFGTEGRPFTESVVIFNTVCSKCHEAQCSGRLSFDDALEKSTNHILRHYGRATGEQQLQEELFDILNYMKSKCAYYPVNNIVPINKVWESKVLEEYATLQERYYFLPVGELTAGNYRMEIELEKDARATVHLISEEFDMVVEDCVDSVNDQIEIEFSVEEAGKYFFRMYPRQPVSISRLSITRLDNKL